MSTLPRLNAASTTKVSSTDSVYCIKKYEIDGFPTLLTFIDGVLKEEYPDSDEVAPLYKYIVGLQKLAKPDAVANAPLVHAQKYLHPSSEYEGSQVIHSSEDADSTPNDTSSLLFIGILAVIALFVIVLAMRRGSGRKYQSLGRSLED